MNFICIDLTFVALLEVFETIGFHSQPIVPCSENFIGHYISIGMGFKRSLMDFLDEHVYFVSIHASKHNHVVIYLVEYITIEEEIGGQPPKGFLIPT